MRLARVTPFGAAVLFPFALCLLAMPSQALADPVITAVIAGQAISGSMIASAIFQSIATFALSSLVSSVFGKDSAPKQDRDFSGFQAEAQGRLQVVRSAVATRKIVYGEVMVSGPLVYAETTGSSNEYLHMVIPLAPHECASIEEVWFGDEKVGELDGSGNVTTGRFATWARIKKHLGTSGEAADADLVAESAGKWTTDHKLSGITYVYVRLKWSQSIWPGGIPNVKCLVRGKKVLDTRDSVTRYSNNWALVVRDYLRTAATEGGLGADADEVDDTAFSTAANVCDERVTMATYSNTFTLDASTDTLTLTDNETTIATGDAVNLTTTGNFTGTGLATGTTYYYIRTGPTSAQLATTYANSLAKTAINITGAGTGTHTINHVNQARYTANGTVDTANKPKEILAGLLSAAAGILTYPQGQFKALPAAYDTPTVTLTASDLRGPVKLTPRIARRELFNAVQGVYSNPANYWQPSNFPIVTNATYETDDGGERIVRDIELAYTTDAVRAQRIAKVHLEKSRQGMVVVMPCKFTAFKLAMWDTVQVTLSQFGWSAKVFRVINWKLAADAQGVDLVLREDTSASYDWASGDATVVDPAPDTVLPSIAVSALSGLALSSGTSDLFITGDGTVQSRIKASWTAVANVFVTSGGHIEVQFKKSADSIWQDAPDVDGAATQTYIGPVDDGVNYDVRARAVSTIGVEGSWATVSAHTVAGKSAAPTDPSGFVAQQSGPGTVLFSCDAIEDADLKRVEVRLLDFDDTTWANGIPVCNILKGFTSTTGAVPPGSWTFLARSFDTSENASDNTARADLEVTADGFTAVIDRQDYPDWLGTLTNMVARYDGTLTAKSQSVAGVARAPAYVDFPGISGNYITTPDAVANRITSDIDIRVHVKLADWTPAGFVHLIGKHNSGGGSNASWSLYVAAATGQLLYGHNNGATFTPVFSSTGAAITDGTASWVRVTWKQSTGAVNFYKGSDNANWTQIGTADVAGPTAANNSGSNALTLLADVSGTLFLADAEVYRAQVYSGINGTLAVDLNPNLATDGASSFTAATGEVWTRAVSGGTPARITVPAQTGLGWEVFDQFVPNPYTTCTYEAPAIDKSIDGSLRVYADIVSELGPGETTGIANPLHSIDYKLSAGSYDGFEPWVVGYADFRYLKTKLTLDTSVGNCAIRGFNTVADGQAREETGSNITVGASGQAVTFSRPFHSAPIVQARNEGSTPLLPTVTGTSGSGATIHLYNTSGTEVGGVGGYTATGI